MQREHGGGGGGGGGGSERSPPMADVLLKTPRGFNASFWAANTTFSCLSFSLPLLVNMQAQHPIFYLKDKFTPPKKRKENSVIIY